MRTLRKYHKKTQRQKVRHKLDKLWSQKVRSIGKCEFCGSKDSLNGHHIYSRTNLATRWDLNNGVCLCSGCHVFRSLSAHKSPMEFSEWLIEQRGEEWLSELRLKAKSVVKYTIADLEDILERLDND